MAQTLEAGPEGNNERRGSICLARSSDRVARNEGTAKTEATYEVVFSPARSSVNRKEFICGINWEEGSVESVFRCQVLVQFQQAILSMRFKLKNHI